MSNSFSGSGGCQERTGFLFPHACDNLAAYACGTCGKAICADHTVWRGENLSCTTCAKTANATHETSNTSSDDSSIGDPYFYRQHHMQESDGAGDFTEGEQAALFEGDDADLAGFEDDMGAS